MNKILKKKGLELTFEWESLGLLHRAGDILVQSKKMNKIRRDEQVETYILK